jgi:GntR family transcriptional repressor for pyruvate dehydrogenase complex
MAPNWSDQQASRVAGTQYSFYTEKTQTTRRKLAQPTLKPINRPNLYDIVADQIRTYIVAAGLQEGDSLPGERELARQLGVSRTSMREGLRMLQIHGLVNVRPGRAPTVGSVNLGAALEYLCPNISTEEQELIDLCQVREALEVKAVSLAAERITETDLQKLTETVRRMEARVAEGEKPVQEDVEFHSLIFHVAQNRVLLRILEAISDLLITARERGWVKPAQALRQHQAILRALAARDRAKAVSAMEEHVRHSTRLFLTGISKGGDNQ